MKNLVQDGATIDFTATADVNSGDVVEIGDMIGIAATDVKNGELGTARVEGVYEIPKASAASFAQGETVYWKSNAIGVDNTGKYAGKAWVAGASSETTAIVKINFGSA